jgi:hypothetical protein
MPFLLLGMRSKSLVVSNSHYATLPEDIRENTINAIKPRKEEITPQTIQETDTDPPLNPTHHQSQGQVLIISEHFQTGSRLLQQISTLLDAQRISHTVINANEEHIKSKLQHKPRHSVIVFDEIKTYKNLNPSQLDFLHSYCNQESIGLLIIPGSYVGRTPALSLMSQKAVAVQRVWIDGKSPLLRVVKGNQLIQVPVEIVPLLVRRGVQYDVIVKAPVDTKSWKAVVVDDKGNLVGVRRVVFGFGDLSVWMVKLLFVDMLRSLSMKPLGCMSLERKILVDIDDIFVAKSGTKFTRKDVEAMVKFQESVQKDVPGFRFNLGLSGSYYLKSSLLSEQDGDHAVIEMANHFWWFGHIYDHSQPHLHNTTEELISLMNQNKEFARMHKIPMQENQYSIAPHHSGVYPVHEPLYKAWKTVWNIRVTSTEEYPHLRPPYNRRGFIYKDISVLPRQTCGLFTHTYLKSDYPGGFERLVESSEGGEAFFTIYNNPVAIFMTHLSNYGNDRLALLWLNMTIQFIHKWTNLKLSTSPPLELAKHYFDLFPEEATTPFWQNPCNDKRHLEIWPSHKECHLPSVVVVGPQKTGTTALHQFLRLHPELLSNRPHPTSYEELQFFRNPNYANGLDWYMSFFPSAPLIKGTNRSFLLFEKSANYFDYPLAPKRMSYLLPNAKLIAILLDPIQRAYSWYQHQRAHQEKAALDYSFYDIITMNSSCTDRKACALRSRCLDPGHYEDHLEEWLTYYEPSQVSQ